MKMKYRTILTAICLAHTANAQTTATWTNPNGGSWDTAANWGGTVPTWGPDLTVDFSTLNITANRNLNLTSTGKIVGKIIFGDTTPSHQWIIDSGNGPLTLQTTTGQPEIQVVAWSSVITVGLGGSQGFEKTGPETLRLNNNGNPITGEILVSDGVLQIRDGTTSNPTVFVAATMGDRSLRITDSGILDLWRVNATATQNVTWTLPATTLENGGVIRFRTNNAQTYNHSMGGDLTIGTGGGTIRNNGGSGVQSITLSGALSGSGALAYAADAGGTTRRLSISSADNTYSGDWTVSHAGTGTAFLRADAANALGTGIVTLESGATLENNATNGINSLSGVKLSTATSSLTLGANPWTNASATLTAEAGTINLGGNASSIGTFVLDSAGSVTLNATSGGSLAAANFDIRQGTLTGTGELTGTGGLSKSTSGTATLAGSHSYTGATSVSAGTLLITGALGDSAVTVAANATIGGAGSIGGSLHFDSGSNLLFSLTDTLTVNGASVTFGGFGIANLIGFDSSVPDSTYTLIDGTADFDFTNVGNLGFDNAVPLGGGRFAYLETGSLALVVIPEPAAALLGGLGLLALLRRRR